MVTTRTRPWPTYQDYLDIPGDDRYELINGEFILVSAPNRAHQTASMGFSLELGGVVRGGDLGWVFAAPFEVVLTDPEGINIIQPDIIFVSQGARTYHHPRQHTGRARFVGRNPVPLNRKTGQNHQARPLRPPRRQRILDSRPRRSDRNRHASERRRFRDGRGVRHRRHADLAHPERILGRAGQRIRVTRHGG